MPQPTVSKHLRVLREAGFVESTVDAQRRLYRLRAEPLQEVDAWLAPFRRFWSAHLDALERHLDRMVAIHANEEEDEEKIDDRSRAVHAGSGQRRGGPKGRREVDARSRQGAAPLAGESLAGADRPGAPARVGALRRRSEAWLTAGTTVKLTTVGAPTPQVSETTVTRADAPRVLEYNWGGNEIRWELEAVGGGTRLTLWHNIDRRFIAMGAAGWHICLDVLDRLLGGTPIGRIVGGEAMKFDWPRLNSEYARQFGIDTSNRPPQAAERS